jgi:urea transport system ATP-binding protein
VQAVAEEIGLADKLQTEAGLLSHGQKQWLEIGMLLIQEPGAADARRADRRHERA